MVDILMAAGSLHLYMIPDLTSSRGERASREHWWLCA